MTAEEWTILAKAIQKEHERVWKKHHSTRNMEGMQFALELQSYAMICYTAAEEILKRDRRER